MRSVDPEQSVRLHTAVASSSLIQRSAVLDSTEHDFDFLTSNKVWIATFFFSSRRRHTRYWRDWSSDVCLFRSVSFQRVFPVFLSMAVMNDPSSLSQFTISESL